MLNYLKKVSLGWLTLFIRISIKFSASSEYLIKNPALLSGVIDLTPLFPHQPYLPEAVGVPMLHPLRH